MNIPDQAAAIIQATADEYGVPFDQVMAEWTKFPGGIRSPEVAAARRAAIARVSNEEVDGRPRYTIAKLCEWFQISRPALNRARAASSDYAPRRSRVGF